ncbi:MAG: Zn-dependent protease with chaperone function, partial [Planctomycetaceae bacterium]|nr:Zn-dependent protease with chaperone function [Planctomycetaceae bacterium]
MPIRVTCGSCQKSLSVKDEYAGKSGKCPQCGAAVAIPAATYNVEPVVTRTSVKPPVENAAPAEESTPEPQVRPSARAGLATAAKEPSQVMREILGGFHGQFPRVRPTLGYRLAALIVAIVMILLPLVYVGLVGVVGYALYWHATTNHTVFSSLRGMRASKGAAFIYLGPLLIGGVLILFMIKPLFARPPKRQEELELTIGEEPILHSFVTRLCEAVNAPRPSLIEVDCEVNAAAYFRHGWWGFFTNDLALRIGLPLLSTLDTRQLAGVLAHELGHFSQGAGMRLSYIIRNINNWFLRVIYERDEWDEAITE